MKRVFSCVLLLATLTSCDEVQNAAKMVGHYTTNDRENCDFTSADFTLDGSHLQIRIDGKDDIYRDMNLANLGKEDLISDRDGVQTYAKWQSLGNGFEYDQRSCLMIVACEPLAVDKIRLQHDDNIMWTWYRNGKHCQLKRASQE